MTNKKLTGPNKFILGTAVGAGGGGGCAVVEAVPGTWRALGASEAFRFLFPIKPSSFTG